MDTGRILCTLHLTCQDRAPTRAMNHFPNIISHRDLDHCTVCVCMTVLYIVQSVVYSQLCTDYVQGALLCPQHDLLWLYALYRFPTGQQPGDVLVPAPPPLSPLSTFMGIVSYCWGSGRALRLRPAREDNRCGQPPMSARKRRPVPHPAGRRPGVRGFDFVLVI